MTLHFPNESRSFDASRNRVRFWGYDGALEISFFVEEEALRKLGPLSPEASNIEALLLQVFDAARERIYKVADEVHSYRPNGSYAYSLAAADF